MRMISPVKANMLKMVVTENAVKAANLRIQKLRGMGCLPRSF